MFTGRQGVTFQKTLIVNADIPLCGRLYRVSDLFAVSSLSKIYSGDQIMKNDLGGNVARVGDRKGMYRDLVGRSEGKRRLGRPRHRWEDNIDSLDTRRRLLYLKTQFVPRSKHFSSRL